jgi:acetoin utilization protein AcuB
MKETLTRTVDQVMHPMPHSIGLGQTLAKAKEIMSEHSIRHLPVLDSGSVVGVLTDRDIQFVLAAERKESDDLLVKDCYTSEPYVVEPGASVADVARTMAHGHLGCAIVVEKSKLKGIFTTVDACRLLSEILSESVEQ